MFAKKMTLTETKVGDMLALGESPTWDKVAPRHRLLIVERLTASQVCCRDEQGGAGEWRFRKSDGKLIGHHYRYAQAATPELVAATKAARAMHERIRVAKRDLSDLECKPLHQLNLNIEQLEALAKAWTDIKAMRPAA